MYITIIVKIPTNAAFHTLKVIKKVNQVEKQKLQEITVITCCRNHQLRFIIKLIKRVIIQFLTGSKGEKYLINKSENAE